MRLRRHIEKIIIALFPTHIQRLFGFMYGVLYKRISYSQYGEDIICYEYFQRKNIHNGIYLDIGAFHPIWYSNTNLFHKKGWSGIAVDIDEAKLRSFKLMRGKKVMTILGAITAGPIDSGQVLFYKFRKIWSEIDTTSLEAAEFYRKQRNTDYDVKKINTIDINKLMSTLPRVNFINIDAEGLDEEILLSLNFSIYSPELIVFEDNKNFGGSKKVKNTLLINGYQHLFSSGGSVGYFKA